MTRTLALLAVLLLPAVALTARAEDKPAPSGPELPARVESRHTITLGGHPVDYRAIAETIALHDQKGAATASIYTVSYLADAAAGQRRPVAFVFNGGPGAASVFLHLGALGPRILETPGDGSLPNPPYRLVDNPSILARLSPTSSSSIRSAPGSAAARARKIGRRNPNKPFFNVQCRSQLARIRCVRLWLTGTSAGPAPVYLVGESYGGYRVAALAQEPGGGRGDHRQRPGDGLAGARHGAAPGPTSSISWAGLRCCRPLRRRPPRSPARTCRRTTRPRSSSSRSATTSSASPT